MASRDDADVPDAALCHRDAASPRRERAKGQATAAADWSRLGMTLPTAGPSWWLVKLGRPVLDVQAPGRSPQPQERERAPVLGLQDRCARRRQRPGARRACRIAPRASTRGRILALGGRPEGCFPGAYGKAQQAAARTRAPAPRLQEQRAGRRQQPGARRRCRIAPPASAHGRILVLAGR